MTTVEPTWQLVLDAAARLGARFGEFRLHDLIVEVQRVDPSRDRGSIQPVIQGMTVNAGKGPPIPSGKPLRRVGHGWYTVDPVGAVAPAETPEHAGRRTSGGPRQRDLEVRRRLGALAATFSDCVDAYDNAVPFRRSGQYEKHRLTIDRRRCLGDVTAAATDGYFVTTLYETLHAWGIGRRGSHLVPLAEFHDVLASFAPRLARHDRMSIDDPTLDAAAVALDLWSLIGVLPIVDNVSRIVPGTKTIHHLLPDLVPPMDRKRTGAFFLWSTAAPQTSQRNTFVRTFMGFAELARRAHPSGYVGTGSRSSASRPRARRSWV